ncbi:MAG TPA: hypothetical protein O0X42_02590, partial [Methanocorpusculum sp.]|nr:hypothetical protein [Methanocorpusculum sp.]
MDETVSPNNIEGAESSGNKIMNLHREASGKEVHAAGAKSFDEAEPGRSAVLTAEETGRKTAVPAEDVPVPLSDAEMDRRIQEIEARRRKDRENIVIRPLPLKRCREYPISGEYIMRVNRAEYIRDPEKKLFDIERNVCYDFYREEDCVETITFEFDSEGYFDDRMVLWIFRKGLAKRHNLPFDEKAETVMRSIPPWERSEPVREIEKTDSCDLKFSLNENGFARRFEEECKDWLIFDTASSSWYAWNETHWEPALERLGKALRFVADSMRVESEFWHNEYAREEQKALMTKNNTRLKELSEIVSALDKQCMQINQKHAFDAMADIAAKSTMCINLEEMGNAEILTFRNGGVNCKTGELLSTAALSCRRNMYPVHFVDRVYTKGSSPVHFEEHLKALFTDNTTDGLSDDERVSRSKVLCAYFKRLLGYALYAGNPRSLFVFLWGTGANGKSTTVEAIRSAIPSEFAEVSSMELLASRDEKPLSGLFNGVGRRVVYFAEISDSKDSKGPKISREAVKNLSGDKVKNLRELYGKPVDKQVLCLPVAATNDLPSFDKDLDKALLRRIITIPFMHEFTGSDKRLDMADVLAKEADGIFSLMVDELCAYAKAEASVPNSGIFELPEFCRSAQGKLLSGDA